MIKIIIFVVYLLLTLNIASYTYMRAKWKGRAELITHVREKNGVRMTYCLPGLASNPVAAFKFLETDLVGRRNLVPGSITYVKYSNWGFDAETIARQIVVDIKKHGYVPYIISVSVGDQVARHVKRYVPETKVISINPAPNCDCLKYDVQIWGRVKAFFAELSLSFIGWFGQIRSIKTDVRRKQSLSLYVDMLNSLTTSTLEVEDEESDGLVFSYWDKTLDNNETREIFLKVSDDNIVVVETEHANTAVGGNLYRDKVVELIEKIY